MAEERTGRSLDRIVNFTDAAVAIAITLLVLPLVDVAREVGRAGLGGLLLDNLGLVIAFCVTFAVTARLWIAHHRVFERVAGYTYAIVGVNFVWLFAIVALPFASNLYSAATDADGVGTLRDVTVLYIAVLLVAAASLLVIEMLLLRRPELIKPGQAEGLELDNSITTVTLEVIALVLALAVPQVGLFWLLLLVLSRPATLLVARLRRAARRR